MENSSVRVDLTCLLRRWGWMRWVTMLALITVALALFTGTASAEGSATMCSSGGDRPFFEYRSDLSGGIQRRTTMYVYVQAGETLQLGSSAVGVGSGVITYVRPDGNTGSCAAAGKINTRTEEFNGPGNPGGFTPCSVTVGAAEGGIWTVNFVSPDITSTGNPGAMTCANAWGAQAAGNSYITAWDITVRNAGVVQNGRAYANYMALNIGANTRSLSSQVYIQTQDGYRYRVDLNGIDPFGFIFFANPWGIVDTNGNPLYKSVQLLGTNPNWVFPGGASVDSSPQGTHKMFLNIPDYNDLPASAPIYLSGSATATWLEATPQTPNPATNFTFTGIEGTGGQAGTNPMGGDFEFDSTFEGSFRILLDINNDGTYGNGIDRYVTGLVHIGPNSVYWDGLDGAGDPVPAGFTTYNAVINLFVGEVHFPFIDPENNPAGIIIERQLLNTNPPNPYLVYYNDTGLSGGTPPSPISALLGVNSTAGAHSFSSSFGDGKAIETWTYLSSPQVVLISGVTILESDLSITKSHAPASLQAGDSFTYTITVHNGGPSDTVGAAVADVFPANLTNISWTCAITTGTGACGSAGNVGNINTSLDLNNGATATFTVTATLLDTASGTINNTVVVTRELDNFDPNLVNNSATDSFNLVPDMKLDITDNVLTATPGGGVIYTLAYENIGDGNATGVVLTVTVPANTVFDPANSDGWTCVPDGNAGSTCTLNVGSVGVGGTGTADFAVTVADPIPFGVTQIALTGSVADDGTHGADPTNNNTDTEPTPVDSYIDRWVTIDDGGITAEPGDTVAYTVSYGNYGNQNSPDTVLTVTVPAYATFNASASTAGWACIPAAGGPGAVCTLAVGTVNGNASGDVTFAVTVDSTLPAGVNQITIPASVAGSGTDTVSGNNSDSDNTPLDAAPDLAVTITDGGVITTPGGSVTYTVGYDNHGNQNATNAEITVTIPPNTTFDATNSTGSWTCVPPSGAAGAVCTAALGDLDVGDSGSINLVLIVDNPVPAGTTAIDVTVDIADDGTNGADLDSTDNTASENTPLDAAPDLSSTKVYVNLVDADGDGVDSAGDTLSYTVVITNNGDTGATNVSFSDTPGANTTLDDGTVTTTQGTITSGNDAGDTAIAVTIGTIPGGGATVTITFDVVIAKPLPVGITQVANQGVVDSTEQGNQLTDDPGEPGTDDPTVTPLDQVPVVASTKTDALQVDADGDGVVSRGDTLRYTVVITNSGTAVATGMLFSDTPDTNTSLVSTSVTTTQGAITGGNAGTPPVTVDIGTLAIGDSVTITFDVVIDPAFFGSQVANQGLITGNNFGDTDTDDPDTPSADDPTITPVAQIPVMSASKTDTITDTDSDGHADPGEIITYTVITTNTGGSAATNVVFTDMPDANTTLVVGSVTTTQGTITTGTTAGDTTVEVAVGNINPNDTVTITFDVTVNDPFPVGVTQVANQGDFDGDNIPPYVTDDPDDPTSDTDPTITPIWINPVLDVTKNSVLFLDADANTVTSPGDVLQYTVVIDNPGPETAVSLVFSDTPDANTTLVVGSVTTSQGLVAIGNTVGDVTVQVNIGDVAASGSVTIHFNVTISTPLPVGVTQVANQGLVTGPNVDNTPTDDPETPASDDPTIDDVNTGYIGDFVWNDTNGNGIQDPGEFGLPDAIISLTWYGPDGILGTADDLLINTTSDANGYYEFYGLPAGHFKLEITPPDGYSLTPPAQGSDPDLDSDFDMVTHLAIPVDLAANEMRTDIDAALAQMDMGDLPASYNNSLVADDGARHIVGDLYLGTTVDGKSDGTDSPTSNADLNDDGLSRTGGVMWRPGNTVGITANVTGGDGYLAMFFDWNNDGVFDSTEVLVVPVVEGPNPIDITIPATYTTGQTLFARFRLYPSDPGTALPTGIAVNGEVEDYMWRFSPTAVELVSTQARANQPAAKPSPWWLFGAVLANTILGAAVWLRRRK